MRVTDPRSPAPVRSGGASAGAEQAAPEPRRGLWSGLADKFEDARQQAGRLAHLAHDLWDERVAPSLHVQNDPRLPVPPDHGGMTVATFNIQLGGKQLEAVEVELQTLSPDVACLQECSPESAQRLARALKMNVAWFTGGKAILSRYPIADASNEVLPGRLDDRLKAAWEHRTPEPLETRSALRATLRIGGRAVDVLDAHLALGDERSNARQLDRLGELVAERERLGHAVILAGDFNDNLALARPGAADPRGVVATPTDTPDEFRVRWPRSVVGNIADPGVAAAAGRLLDRLAYFWDAPDRRVVVGGATLTLDEVRAELGKAAPGSARGAALLKALDGTTHLSANKRFDNILASRSVRFASATIDQTARASDHQAVLAEVRWD